jgi:hypothetical protein
MRLLTSAKSVGAKPADSLARLSPPDKSLSLIAGNSHYSGSADFSRLQETANPRRVRTVKRREPRSETAQ